MRVSPVEEDVVNPVRNSSGALSPAAEQRGSISNGVNHGTVCVRGSYGCDFIHSPDRLTTPLIKVNPVRNDGALNTALSERHLNSEYGSSPLLSRNGGTNGVKESFAEVSWNQVLELVATEFKRIKDEHGPNSLAILGSSKCTNEENFLLQKFARAAIGTNNIDHCARL